MTELTSALQQKEKTAQLFWTAFILMFFLIQAIIWTVAISLTAGDPSHRVLEGYDERALHWDEELAQRRASEKLGWQSEFHFDPAGDIQDFHGLTLELKTSDGTPVQNASLTLTGFHRSFAALPQEIVMKEVGPGVYAGKIRVTRSGLWQIQGTAKQDDSTYLINKKIPLTASN